MEFNDEHRAASTSLDSPEISSHPPPPAGPHDCDPKKQSACHTRPKQPRSRAQCREAALQSAKRLADDLLKCGRGDLAESIGRCQVTKQLWICGGCGQTSYVNYSCHLRICPLCAYRVSRERATAVGQLFGAMDKPKWLTLTQKRCVDLDCGVRRIRDAFAKWRRLKQIRKRIRGGVYQIECVPKPDGWHVHLHVLIDSVYLPKPLIWSTWAKALGQASASVDIQGNLSRERVSSYIVKYTTKPARFKREDTARVVEFLTLLENQHLYGTFGTCHNQLPQPPPPAPVACPHCGKPGAMIPFVLGYVYFAGSDWSQIRDAVQNGQPLFVPKDKGT